MDREADIMVSAVEGVAEARPFEVEAGEDTMKMNPPISSRRALPLSPICASYEMVPLIHVCENWQCG